MKRFAHEIIAGALLVGAACESPDSNRRPDAPQPIQRAVTNPNAFSVATFDGSCDFAQQSRLRGSLSLVQNAFIYNQSMILGCLKEGNYQGPLDDQPPEGTHGEWIVEQMTRDAPAIPFSCKDIPIAGAKAIWNGTHIVVSPYTLQQVSSTELGGFVGHEIAHMMGFSHLTDMAQERGIAIPYQIQACLGRFDEGENRPSPILWTNGRLSDFSGEVALQAVGHRSGVSTYTLSADRDFKSTCPYNFFAYGISGYKSNGVQSVTMDCKAASESAATTSPGIGDSQGGTFFNQRCYPGEVMVGLWGQAGLTVNTIGPVCAPISEVQSGGTATQWFDPPNGAEVSGDPTWKRVCPSGMAVRSFRGHFGVASNGASRRINSAQVVCQSINSPTSLDVSVSGGVASPSTKPWTTVECSGRSGLTRIEAGADNGGLRRLSGACINYSGNSGSVLAVAPAHILSGVGANFGEAGYDEVREPCPSNHVLVGVDVNFKPGSPNHVRAIRGLCASDVGWASQANTTITVLPAVGPADGSWERLTCGNRMFLEGFRTRGVGHIEDVYTICRSFQ